MGFACAAQCIRAARARKTIGQPRRAPRASTIARDRCGCQTLNSRPRGRACSPWRPAGSPGDQPGRRVTTDNHPATTTAAPASDRRSPRRPSAWPTCDRQHPGELEPGQVPTRLRGSRELHRVRGGRGGTAGWHAPDHEATCAGLRPAGCRGRSTFLRLNAARDPYLAGCARNRDARSGSERRSGLARRAIGPRSPRDLPGVMICIRDCAEQNVDWQG